jgi:hypothetical protein
VLIRFPCAAWKRRARKIAATTAIKRHVVPPTAIPAVWDVESGGGSAASVSSAVSVEVGVGETPLGSGPPDTGVASDCGASEFAEFESVEDPMGDAVVTPPTSVELVVSTIEEVCKVSTRVRF